MTDHSRNCLDPLCLGRIVERRGYVNADDVPVDERINRVIFDSGHDTCANAPAQQAAPRQPKVGDRVKLWPSEKRKRIPELLVGESTVDRLEDDGFWPQFGWGRRYFADRGMTWDFAEPASEPHRAAGNDGHGHRWKHPMETAVEPAKEPSYGHHCEACPMELSRTSNAEWKCTVCGKSWKGGVRSDGMTEQASEPAKPEPAADGLTEREREAWQLYHADAIASGWNGILEWLVLTPDSKRSYLAIRDRAEAIFKARADEQCLITQQLCQERVKRAEQERDRHKQAYDVAMQGWGQCSQERDAAQADVERLQVQLAGCGVAAGGWAKGENDCKPGDYGHSASFDAVKQLRAEVERLRQAEREGSDVRECLRKQLEKAGARVRDYGTELQGRREAMRAVIAEWDSPRQKPSHQGALDFIKWIREQASKD